MQLSEQHKGFVYIALGVVLLFHTLGLFTVGLSYILIGFALYLIVQGALRTGLDKQIKKYINKKGHE